MSENHAFTLIELLIVVAIIAILAAIAVPNFLEAQVRAKVSRCKNDMRTLATALESYRTDNTQYPVDGFYWLLGHVPANRWPSPYLMGLTTPIAYISTVPDNVFYDKYYTDPNDRNRKDYRYGAYISLGKLSAPNSGRLWVLNSFGPDLYNDWGIDAIKGDFVMFEDTTHAFYDPTNGTMSKGDIVRTGP